MNQDKYLMAEGGASTHHSIKQMSCKEFLSLIETNIDHTISKRNAIKNAKNNI